MSVIIKATRAHYAALQHRKEPDRIGLDYEVIDKNGHTLNSGTVWVKCRNDSARRAEVTRLTNRLQRMYPFEWKTISCEYRGDS